MKEKATKESLALSHLLEAKQEGFFLNLRGTQVPSLDQLKKLALAKG